MRLYIHNDEQSAFTQVKKGIDVRTTAHNFSQAVWQFIAHTQQIGTKS